MDKSGKFLLPSPKFLKLDKTPAATPHFLSPQGMMLPKEQQPPPMYGPRGSTVPPKFLGHQQTSPISYQQHDRTQKFYCDPCEAEFHTSTDFKVHKSEHVQCEIDNCSFRGHPSFMDTHIGLQHATGLYTELKKLSTPEEIAEWRAQRKKNYPTLAAVLQKQKAREQRMMRGEKLEAKKNRFGNREDRRQIRTEQQGEQCEPGQGGGKRNSKKQNRKRNRFGKPVNEKDVKKEEEPVKKSEEETVESAVCEGFKMFKGTGGMADYKKVKKVETHALTSLLGMYGSDSEDEEDNSDEDTKNINQTVGKIPLKDGKDELSGEGAPITQADANNLQRKAASEDSSHVHVFEKSQRDTSDSSARQDTNNALVPQNKSETPAPPNTSDAAASQDTSDTAVPKDTDEDEAPKETPIPKSSMILDQPQPRIYNTVDTLAKQCPDDEVPKQVPIDRPQTAADSSAPQESDDEGPEEAPIVKSLHTPDTLQSTSKDNSTEVPTESPVAGSSNVTDKAQSTVPRKKDKKLPPKKKPRTYGLDYRKLRSARQNTLLEKLLDADIRHERNVLLQCVRFVVQNNFFGIGSPPNPPDA